MPLVQVLAVALRWLLKYMITKALIMLGISYTTYQGIDLLFESIEDQIWNQLAGLPSDVYQIATLVGIDSWISINLSAISAYLAIRGIQQGLKSVFTLSPVV